MGLSPTPILNSRALSVTLQPQQAAPHVNTRCARFSTDGIDELHVLQVAVVGSQRVGKTALIARAMRLQDARACTSEPSLFDGYNSMCARLSRNRHIQVLCVSDVSGC